MTLAVPARVERHGQGIALKILATLLFAGMAACVRLASDSAPVGEIVFFRSAVALVPVTIYLALRGEFPAGLATRRPFGHALRSIAGLSAMFLVFWSYSLIPLANTTAIGYLTPLLTVGFAVVVLKERPTLITLLALLVGFSGILVMFAGSFAGSAPDRATTLGYLAAGVAAMISAIALGQLKRLTATEHSGAIAFYFALTCTIGGLLTLPFGWQMPSAEQLLLLVGAGLLGGFAQIFLTEAYSRSSASTVASVDYVSIVWMLALDFLVFSLVPEPATVGGVLMIVGAAICVTLFGRRRRPYGPLDRRK